MRLRKENVIEAIKRSKRESTDFSDRTGIRNKNGFLRGLAALAAALAITVSCALFERFDGVKVIKTDTFYKGYENRSPMISVQSYEEVERAVHEIIYEKSNENARDKSPETTGKAPDGRTAATTAEVEKPAERILKGYDEYAATVVSVFESAKKQADAVGIYGAAEKKTFSGDFEADVVKSDGEYIYIVATENDPKTGRTAEQIKIVKAAPADRLELVSTITLSDSVSSDSFDECLEIYLKDDELVALTRRYDYSADRGASAFTAAVRYDVSEPLAPKKIGEYVQDGEYVASRLHGDRLYVATEKPIYFASGAGESLKNGDIPVFSVNGVETKLKAEEIFIAVNDPEASYLVVTATDLSDPLAQMGRLAVLGCGKEIFCSPEAIVASREFSSVDAPEDGARKKLTEIYRFNFEKTSIKFAGSYVVEGSLASGLYIDGENGFLRASADNGEANAIYLFNKKMDFAGGLKGIFPGEKIESVKHNGRVGYVASESGKALTVDFSDPQKPEVAGTISSKIFSDDLIAVSDSTLLGIGSSASEDGSNGPTSISLLDASDPKEPKTTGVYVLDGDCVPLDAGDARRAVFNSDGTVFGIPVVKTDPSTGTQMSAYVLFDISDGDVTLVGTYSHDEQYVGDAAVRAVCIGDILYTVSGKKIVASSIEGRGIISERALR